MRRKWQGSGDWLNRPGLPAPRLAEVQSLIGQIEREYLDPAAVDQAEALES